VLFSFLLILPAIVQDIVNNQSLPVNGGSFIALSPNTLNVSIESGLNTPLPATLDPLTLFLYNKDTPEFSPFLNVTIPQMAVSHQTAINVVNQSVTITNETELVTWFNKVFDQTETDLSARGDTTVHLGALHSKVHLDKTMTIPTLNDLTGFGIINLQLVLPPEPDGTNIRGTLNLPNWSKLTIGLGNVTLDILSGDFPLGFATVWDVVLPPGNTTFDFFGTLYLNDILSNLGTILTTQAPYLQTGNIGLTATGNSTIINGEHIGFVEQILNNKQITSEMPILGLVTQVLGGLLGSNNTGGLVTVVEDMINNATFVEEVIGKLNGSGIAQTLNGNGSTTKGKLRRALPVPLALLRAGARMNMH
jgi:hypothetical protein